MMLDTFVQTNVSIPHVWHHFLTSIVPERAGQNKPALLECSGSGVWKGVYGHFKRKKAYGEIHAVELLHKLIHPWIVRFPSAFVHLEGKDQVKNINNTQKQYGNTNTKNLQSWTHIGYIHRYVRMHGLRHHTNTKRHMGHKMGQKIV